MSEALARILLDASIRIVLASLAIGVLLRLCRYHSNELRHTVWTIVVCAMLLMPLLPLVLPSLTITFRIPQTSEVAPEAIPQRPLPASFDADEVAAAPSTGYGEINTNTVDGSQSVTWSSVLMFGYVAGVVFLLIRLCAGWVGMQRIIRSSYRIAMPGAGPIYQSESVAIPVTVGILRPKVILPSRWQSWPKRDLHTILAHEIAHIRRRDLLTSFVARINCCVFWFHPLAWWLNTQLARCAEEACDNAALRAVNCPQRYAAVLLEMMKAVHHRGARLSWSGVGMKGAGPLSRRIDRIISGKASVPVPFPRKVWVTLTCVIVIGLIAACRQQALPTLAEERQALERVQARQRERTALINAAQARQNRFEPAAKARNLSLEQAANLEAQLNKRPDDLDLRMELLQFYADIAHTKGMDITSIVRRRREHILWFIRSHPGDDVLLSPFVFINTDGTDPFADSEGYARGKALWLAQVEKNPSSPAVLANAAYFIQSTDKILAETFLLRAQQLQPDGPWRERLARLYASTILGASAIRPPFNDVSVNFLVLSNNTADLHQPYAEDVRRRLEASNDSGLLLSVGRILLRIRNLSLDFDPIALGVHYLQRAQTLSPSTDRSEQIRTELDRLKAGPRHARIQELPKEGRYEAAMTLSDRDRFDFFWDLALFNFSYGESFDSAHRNEALTEWEKAATYAAELTRVARNFRNDPEYGNAIFNGNMMLAYVESRKGNAQQALDYLDEALKAPNAAKGGDYPWLWFRICPLLVEQGHEDAVIHFLERFAQINLAKRDEALAAVAQLRNGQRPNWRTL